LETWSYVHIIILFIFTSQWLAGPYRLSGKAGRLRIAIYTRKGKSRPSAKPKEPFFYYHTYENINIDENT
jgi:hypothetical protein